MGNYTGGATTRSFVAPSMKAMEMPCSSDWLYGIPQPLVLQPESVAELLITCVGNHRTGIVRDITKTIAEFGGSITHSKSMALEGLQFVYMASVYVGDREKANLLRMTLNDMRVNATWIPVETTSASGAYGYKKHRLVVHGNQRSGLIFTLSEGLASKGVQINDMKQDTYPGKDRQMMVNWEAELGIPEEVPVDDVRALMADMASKEKNMVVEISA